MELQFYINNIASFPSIVDLLYSSRQNHQCNTLIKCDTLFTSQLYTNYNPFRQESILKAKTDKYTIPTKPILLTMSPSTRKLSGSSESITISTEAKTNYTLLPPSVSKSDLEN